MINVNQITSMLRRLQPDTALQEYAKANKDNPYVMALALSEAKRREKMKIAAQANAPEQPKVVDQAIASMAPPMPEDVGIAQLPAGDMNFAGGGIVAFGSGGDVPRYQSQGLVQGYSHGMVDPSGLFGLGPEAMAYDQARVEEILARKKAAERAARIKFLETAAPETAQRMKQEDAATLTAPSNAPLSAGDMALRRQPVAAPPAGTGGPAQRPPAGGPGTAPAGTQDSLIAQLLKPVQPSAINYEPSQSTMPTYEGIQKLFAEGRPNPADVVDPYAEQRQELTNLAVMQNAQEQADLERRIKERGQLGEKQEARLKAREEKLGKQEKDLGPLAMIQAGFAIMGGQSRSALQNIGMGAQVGLKGYTEGVEKLQNARERIEDGLERIETARRSEGILDDQQRSALKREGNAAVREGKKEGINALATELGVKRSEANAALTAGINVLTKKGEIGSAERLGAAQMQQRATQAAQEQGGQNVRAAAQLTTQERIARMETAARQADAAARLAELRSQVGTKNEAALVADYAKNPMKLKILEQTDPALAAYIRQRIQVMTTPAVQSTPGASGARD